MADYPAPSFQFLVEWGGTRGSFSDVSGLGFEYEVIEYREGADREYATRKMQGRPRYTNIVLKRGIMPHDNELFEWANSIQLTAVQRRDIVISLLNEAHEPVNRWKVKNAFPVRLEGPSLNAAGNAVAIETLELAHEGFLIESVAGKRPKP